MKHIFLDGEESRQYLETLTGCIERLEDNGIIFEGVRDFLSQVMPPVFVDPFTGFPERSALVEIVEQNNQKVRNQKLSEKSYELSELASLTSLWAKYRVDFRAREINEKDWEYVTHHKLKDLNAAWSFLRQLNVEPVRIKKEVLGPFYFFRMNLGGIGRILLTCPDGYLLLYRKEEISGKDKSCEEVAVCNPDLYGQLPRRTNRRVFVNFNADELSERLRDVQSSAQHDMEFLRAIESEGGNRRAYQEQLEQLRIKYSQFQGYKSLRPYFEGVCYMLGKF